MGKNNSLITVAILAIIAIVAYYYRVQLKAAIAKTGIGGTTSTTTTTSTTSGQTYPVTITASDPSDGYVRNWYIVAADAGNAASNKTQATRSGQAWAVNLAAGNYNFAIDLPAAASYGTYSGTIQTPSGMSSFTGAGPKIIPFSVP